MDDQLAELLKSLKAAQDILQPDGRDGREDTRKTEVEPVRPVNDHEPERKVSLGDVAKGLKEYERERMDRK